MRNASLAHVYVYTNTVLCKSINQSGLNVNSTMEMHAWTRFFLNCPREAFQAIIMSSTSASTSCSVVIAVLVVVVVVVVAVAVVVVRV